MYFAVEGRRKRDDMEQPIPESEIQSKIAGK